jgi:hypothetical protein
MHDDGGGPLRANLDRLPVAVAANLARDMLCSRRRDFDKLWLGGWQVVAARQKVARERLQMAVAEKASRLKFRGMDGRQFELGWLDQGVPASARMRLRKAVAFSAPDGSSSCLKYTYTSRCSASAAKRVAKASSSAGE